MKTMGQRVVEARAGPRLRRRDDRRHRSSSRPPTSGCRSRRPTSSRARSWASARASGAARRPLGRRPQHPHRLGPDDPRGRHRRRARLARPQRARRHDRARRHRPPDRRHLDELPTDPQGPKFFELFIADGENLARRPRALDEMVDALRPARRARRRDPGAREARATRSTTRSTRGSRTRSSRRSIARTSTSCVSRLDDVVDGIQAIAETFVIYGVKQPTDEARRLAGILAAQGVELGEALAQARRAQGPRAPPRAGPRARERGRRPVARRRRPAVPRRDRRRSRSSSGATSTRPREHDRRRRGRRRGDRADRRQERLTASGTPGGRRLQLAGDRHPVGDREHHVVHARVARRWSR